MQREHMDVDEWPDDDQVRQTYNFAPGTTGLVYRAVGPERESGRGHDDNASGPAETAGTSSPPEASTAAATTITTTPTTKHKLQPMRWGLIPHWTKRAPDYASQMRTINARDDSLAQSGGLWNTMKQRKRCIVVCEGFYEWLKKNGGRDKQPHFVKRKDGQLMCFAGLWDRVRYEGATEDLYTYTVITTDSNKQLKFLHDRMPVILDNGSDDLATWLDPARSTWSKELQSLLKPYDGELECYPVDRGVGKVGNNSPTFVVPLDSKENKMNIANFFGKRESPDAKKNVKVEEEIKEEQPRRKDEAEVEIKTEERESREDNAPVPTLHEHRKRSRSRSRSRPRSPGSTEGHKRAKTADATAAKTRSAVRNESKSSAPAPQARTDGAVKITDFFSNRHDAA